MSRSSKRQIIYKLYDVDNNFIRVLNSVSSDLGVGKHLFGGDDPLSLIFSTKIDELPSDIQFNNKIKIFVRNKWENEARVVYYGHIISIEPSFHDTQQTQITCLGAISKLKNDYLKISKDDLAYEISYKKIGDHIKEILEHYRATLVTEHGNADRSMIDEPDNYWTDTEYIEDTTDIGHIPYRYFYEKHKDAIKEIGKFLPRNDNIGQYWYWYVNSEGRFVLKKLSSSPDHVLILGKHCTFSMRNNIETVVNRVYFWNERGDYDGEQVRTRYEDIPSQGLYDVIADRVSDNNVSTYTQSRLLAESNLKDRKDNQHEATVSVSEANYDILTFKQGDVVKIINIKDEEIFDSRMIIKSLSLQNDSVSLSLSVPRPDLTTQVETDREYINRQLTWFGEITTRIDGTRIYSGIQHWISDGLKFTPTGNDQIQWTEGSFILPNDVRRVVQSGTLTGMSTGEEYYMFIDEDTLWSTKDTGKVAVESGTCSILEGENFLIDTTSDWKSDEYKGYVLWIDPSGADAKKYIISRNTKTVIYTEGNQVFEVTDSVAPYEIHKFELRTSSKTSVEGLSNSGSTTTLVDTSRTESDNHWDGYRIKILSGDNAGLIRRITNFQSNTFTFSDLPYAIVSDVNYSVYLGGETQIIISHAIPEVDTEGEATIVPDKDCTNVDYQYEGATRAYFGLNARAQLITDLINDRLDTSISKIKSNFSFTSSGAISIPGSGDAGIFLTPNGLYGKNTSGVNTFAIDASDGSAVFRGEVLAGAVISAEIHASLITSGVIEAISYRTSPTGVAEKFVELNADYDAIYWWHKPDSTYEIMGSISTSSITNPVTLETVVGFRIAAPSDDSLMYFALGDESSVIETPLFLKHNLVYCNAYLRIPVGTNMYYS